MNGKTIVRILEQNGFWCVRVRGSHHMMTNGKKFCPVPVHAGRDMALGTVRNIEKITGVKLFRQ